MAADSDDEDMKAAIALSLSQPQPTTHAEEIKHETCPNQPQASSAMPGLLGLDRKAMEAARLARLPRKRERSISPPALRNPAKVARVDEETVTLPSGAKLKMFSTAVTEEQQSRKSDAANTATEALSRSSPVQIKSEPQDDFGVTDSLPQGSIRYPRGVVKKTWAFQHQRNGDDVKLEEVLEPQTLKTAVLSAFQWDADWILSKLKTRESGGNTKCAFVMQAKEESQREEMLEQTKNAADFLRLCFPSMTGQIHCMHSKLMLLFHPNKLRIAIPTANLLNFDWGESGVMENSVFMIDLPRLPDGGKSEISELPPFAKELLHFVKEQGLDQDIRDGILNFDFSATDGMAFVHTVGGIHYDDNAGRTGLPGLARAVRELGLQCENDLEIDFAASSIGSLNDDYLRSIHAAARGEDMLARADKLSTKTKADFFKPPAPNASMPKSKDIRDKFRIYFPTEETVQSSTAGAAGTICLSRKWWESHTFPRRCFRDYKSTRKGLLSHNKILYARGKQKIEGGGKKDVAWAYVGSANMSESAWGKLVYDRKEKKWKINCRNWECGVLLPVPADKLADSVEEKPSVAVKKEKVPGEDSETESEDEGLETVIKREELVDMEVFDGIVKPPWEMPGEDYDGRLPWFFQERH